MALTQVKAAGLAADLIDETKLADDSIDSEHYNDASIDHAHLANDCVDGDNLADNACDSEHYTDGSIDHVHLAGDAVDGDNIADDSIDSEHYVDGSIDHAHLAGDCIDGDNISDDAVAAEHVASNAIVNDSVDASAAIAGTKISPDFGSQAIATTSSITGGTLVGTHGRAPTNTQGGTYTLVAGDAGKVVKAAGNVTLDQNVFADGDILIIYNSTAGDITLIQGTSVTLRLAGDAGTGTRTIAQKGLCTVLNVAANEAVAGGAGVS